MCIHTNMYLWVDMEAENPKKKSHVTLVTYIEILINLYCHYSNASMLNATVFRRTNAAEVLIF